MKKLALIVLALELAVCGCGNPNPTATPNTQTTGNWEAFLSGGTAQASLLNFVVTFTVTNNGPLDFPTTPPISFFNQGACFGTNVNDERLNGTATLNTANAGTVTGTLNLNVISTTNANTLMMSGTLTGNSNGTTTTTGNLTNGVVVGQWTLTGAAGDPSCSMPSPGGTFVMCQDPVNGTCPAPTT
ncbi:MAG TPA: hypothetical protein VHW45_02120 [Candidatus Sulfotelmatobacter sp.]|jgi:hypothetical protein|nr:hypothetical protein [Candidatus Sulfotelmatobacter sp.]